MLAAEWERLSTDEETSQEITLQLQVQKQHPIPTITRVDEVRIRIKSCCMDETDIRMRNGDYPEFLSPPYTPSYACSGVIDEVGVEALHYKKGDEVVAILPIDTKYGAAAEYTVQPVVNIFPKPSTLSHEDACSLLWSGIQGFTCLVYQLRIKPGDRLLLCTSTVCNDLILSSLAGLFGAKLIVVTHSAATTSLFKSTSTASSASAHTASSVVHASTATAASSSSHLSPPLNPLAHILRVVDCTSLSPAQSNQSVLAAVMEESGGLGMDGVIDLQYHWDPWNYKRVKPVTVDDLESIESEQSKLKEEEKSNSHSTLPLDQSDPSLDLADLSPLDKSTLSRCLTPCNAISFVTLVQCLGVQGRLLSSTPNLQMDPPLSRQMFLRGATLGFIFPQQWILGATQRGRLAHVVTEILSLAASGTLQPSIHSRYPLSSINAAWKTLANNCAVGKIVLTTGSSSLQSAHRRDDAVAKAKSRHVPSLSTTHSTTQPSLSTVSSPTASNNVASSAFPSTSSSASDLTQADLDD